MCSFMWPRLSTGPLLYLLYANYLPHCVDFAKTILFADDTTINVSHQNLQELYNAVNHAPQALKFGLQQINDFSISVKQLCPI